MPKKVCLVGSGNWGSAIATKIGKNALDASKGFDPVIEMWVFEEYIKEVDGKWTRPARGAKPPEGKTWVDEGYSPLTDVINSKNENVIYLPGIPLPTSIHANPDIKASVTGANMMIFVIPHNFLAPLVPKMGNAFAKDAKGISLIKGIEFKDGKPILISDMLKSEMAKAEGNPEVNMSVLMGANVANEVGKGDFAECSIGSTTLDIAMEWVPLFNTPDFKADPVADVAGPELCGALKNVIALGAGFSDGLGFGGNTKAAIIRIGLKEMQKFCEKFYGDRNIKQETFLESCGVADLVTTCFGGRNRKCAEIFVKNQIESTPKEWGVIEAEELNGQKLQGTGTAKDVMVCLQKANCAAEFPLMSVIHGIAFEGKDPKDIIKINN
jgi:glycerol-3-phosphate dehydrogenase (NAD+)